MAIKFFLKSNFDYLFLWLLDLHTHMFNNNNAKFLKIFHLQTLNFIKLRPFEEHTKWLKKLKELFGEKFTYLPRYLVILFIANFFMDE